MGLLQGTFGNRLLTIKELSVATRLAVGTLYHLVSQERIPVVRLSSRCIRFNPIEVDRWLLNFSIDPEEAHGRPRCRTL